MKTPCCDTPRLIMDESFSYEVPLADNGTAFVNTSDYASEGYENLKCTNCDHEFSDEEYRFCDGCDSVMFEGYVFNGGTYCDDKCLSRVITKEDWDKIDHENSDDSYWTAWTELREVTA